MVSVGVSNSGCGLCGSGRWCARARCVGVTAGGCASAASLRAGSAGQRVRVIKVELALCSERGTEQGWGGLGAAAPASSHGVVRGVWGAAGEGAPRRNLVWLHLPSIRGVCAAVVVAVGVIPAAQGWAAWWALALNERPLLGPVVQDTRVTTGCSLRKTKSRGRKFMNQNHTATCGPPRAAPMAMALTANTRP